MSTTSTRTQLAIIKDVRCGVGDYGKACLWFTTYINESEAALQVLDWDRAKDLIEAYGVDHVDKLNGRPCWVAVGSGRIVYEKAAGI